MSRLSLARGVGAWGRERARRLHCSRVCASRTALVLSTVWLGGDVVVASALWIAVSSYPAGWKSGSG